MSYQPRHRTDASESAFVNQALEYVSQQLEETLIPPLDGMRYVPMDASTPPGAETYTYYMVTRTGIAQLCVEAAQDIPEADVFMTKYTHGFYSIKAGYKYTVEELANAGFALSKGYPLNLQMQKAMAAKEAIADGHDRAIAFGTGTGSNFAVDVGLVGLANHPNASTYTIPNGAMASPLWSLKTPDEVLADLNGIVAGQISSTRKVHSPKRILLPVIRHQDVMGRSMGDGRDETILSYFVRTRREAGQPIEVDSWNPLATAGSGNGTRMIAYDPRADYVAYVVSDVISEGIPEYRNETWKTPMRGKTAGVIVRKPLSITTADGF